MIKRFLILVAMLAATPIAAKPDLTAYTQTGFAEEIGVVGFTANEVKTVTNFPNRREVWGIDIFSPPHKQAGFYSKIRWQFDCESRKSAVLWMATHETKTNAVIDSFKVGYVRWENVVPGSIGEGRLTFVCRR